jgi:hypothetical protein
MSPLHAATLHTIQQLRQQAALVVELCDAILLSQGLRSVTRLAVLKLPLALRELGLRVQRAIDSMTQEHTP